MVSDEILGVVRCPASGHPLTLADGRLTPSPWESARSYAVVSGIPVLVADDSVAARSPKRGASHPPEQAIVEAFRARSSSYFADNYGASGNPERRRRHRRVAQMVDRLVAPGMAVLDAGAGPAVHAEPVHRRGALYIAVDLSLENLLEGRRRFGELHGVVGSITELPIKDGAFDGVLAIGCLEYVADQETAIRELSRVLRPAGFLVATFANRRSPRRLWDEALIHPLARARRGLQGRGGTVYRRHLSTTVEVRGLLGRANVELRSLEFLNPGLVGAPLSSSRRLHEAQERLTRRAPVLRRLGSELLVVGAKEASPGGSRAGHGPRST